MIQSAYSKPVSKVVIVFLLGMRPNEKISKLFPLKDSKGAAICEQCIVGFVRTGSTGTRVRKRQT